MSSDHKTRISDSSLYDEKCDKCGAIEEQLDRPCRVDDAPTLSPLEGIEIPKYQPVPDRTLRWLMQASSDPAKATMSCEIAERRLADRRAAQVDHFSEEIDRAIEKGDKEFLRSYFREKRELAREDHHEAVAQAVAYLEGRGYRVIPKDVADRMARGLEHVAEWVDGKAAPREIDELSKDLEDAVPILRGEKTDA